MAISDDFTIDYVNQRIYHSTSATTVWTVNELYSYIQDTFDEIAQMDDPVPMSAQTPTEYTLINGWFMNEARENEGGSDYRNCFEYLKTGAIKTTGQDGVVQMVSFGGTYTNAVTSDIGLTVTDDGASTGALLDYDNTNKKWWVRWSATIASGSTVAISGGTGTGVNSADSTTGEQLWANVYTLGTIEQHTNEEQIYVEQNGSRIFSGSEWWPEDKTNATTRHIDVLLKVKEASSEIDGANITVYLRNYPTTGNADLYDHFGIDLTAGGRNAVPLATSPDLNNTDTHATVSGYSGVTIAFVNQTVSYASISGSFTNFETVTQSSSSAYGVFLKQSTSTGSGTLYVGNVVGTFDNAGTIQGASIYAVANDTGAEAYRMVEQFEQQATSPEYSVIIYCNNYTLASVYQYLKYVTRIGSVFTMYPSTYPQGGPLSHSTTKEGQLYIRAHEDTQTTPTNTFSPVKASPFGTFAGGKFFGAQGVWIQDMDSSDVKNYQLIDADGTTQTPPNKQAITISNLLSGDRVSVFRTVSTADSSLNKAMYHADASANTTGSTSFTTVESIAVDTPSTGYVRVVDDSDTSSTRETRYTYSSWSGSAFALSSGSLGRTFDTTTDTAYVPFIDLSATETSASVTVIYTTDRSIIVRVRRYAGTYVGTTSSILPFETTGTFGSGGYSTTTIRTADTIVN